MNFWERDSYFGAEEQGANDAQDDIMRKLSSFSGKSEDELMNMLLSSVGRMKEDGTFDISAVENLFSTASPFLSDMQRARMREIINIIKG